MKPLVYLLLICVPCAPALGAELAIGGSYGTPAGCAILGKQQSVPGGKSLAVAAKTMINGDATCTVVGVSDTPASNGNLSWQAKINCQTGDDVAEAGTVDVVQKADKSAVTVHVADGVGPSGTLKLCPANP